MRRWGCLVQHQCARGDVHIFWACLLKLVAAALGECRHSLWTWDQICEFFNYVVTWCNWWLRAVIAAVTSWKTYLLFSCWVSAYRRLSVWIPKSVNVSVCLAFLSLYKCCWDGVSGACSCLWVVCVFVCVHNRYLVLLLLLLGKVAAVCVEFHNVLAHVVHSVHQELKALLQVVAGGGKRSACQSHTHTVSGKDDD